MFAWLGVEDAEVVLLNDFCWHPSIIALADFLQLLEGDIVHIPAPIELKRDTPFFATADAPIVLVKGGSLDQCNTQMMEVRWVFFLFLEANTQRMSSRVTCLFQMFCQVNN